MKKLIGILIVTFSLSLHAQDLELINQTESPKGHTIVYSINLDGKIDKESYEYFDYPSGKIIRHKKDFSSGNDTVGNVIVRTLYNKVYVCGKMMHFDAKAKKISFDSIETKIEIGYLTADKKIIHLKNGISSDEASAPYIKDNKIYTSANKLIKEIQGEEIYGAASYLLAL